MSELAAAAHTTDLKAALLREVLPESARWFEIGLPAADVFNLFPHTVGEWQQVIVHSTVGNNEWSLDEVRAYMLGFSDWWSSHWEVWHFAGLVKGFPVEFPVTELGLRRAFSPEFTAWNYVSGYADLLALSKMFAMWLSGVIEPEDETAVAEASRFWLEFVATERG